MPKSTKKISKTERILSIYHLFMFCEEVSKQELKDNLHGWCDKTFSRDVALLKRAGVPICFSMLRKAFVLYDESGKVSPRGEFRNLPKYPEGKKDRQYIDKIIRLITIMDELPEEDCDIWYRETFPDVSKRTMQRDFAALNAIGYRIKYERDSFNSYDAGDDMPPRHYYSDRPYGTYDLTTFSGY